MLTEVRSVLLQQALPLSLELVKLFLKITNNQEDELLKGLIDSAIEIFELETSRHLIAREITYIAKGYNKYIELPTGYDELIAVEVDDDFGAHRKLMPDDYQIISGRLKFASGVLNAKITLSFKPSELTEISRNVLLQVVAEFYKNRSASCKLPANIFSKLKRMRI